MSKTQTLKSAKSTPKYNYTALGVCEAGTDEDYHFYATILDATFPHKLKSNGNYCCSVKIADPSLSINEAGEVESCTMVMFAKEFSDLPICRRIGDIIRIHRATVSIPIGLTFSQSSTFKEVKQFHANIAYKSSWALFPLTPKQSVADTSESEGNGHEFAPLAISGKSFTFEKSEQKLLRSIRNWAAKAFEKHVMLQGKWATQLSDVYKVGAP